MDVIFVRHGITELNSLGCFLGSTDCEMTEEGFKQAEAVKSFLENASFDGVYVSPLKRTVQTAEVLDRPFSLDSRLVEMNFGIFEGQPYSEIERKYPNYLHSWNMDYQSYTIPGGESLKDVFERVESFIEDIKKSNEKVLVITHGGVIRCALSLALSNRNHFYRFRADHGSVSIAAFDENYSFIKAVNTGMHLTI